MHLDPDMHEWQYSDPNNNGAGSSGDAPVPMQN